MERIEFTSRSPSETVRVGEHIGKNAHAGDLFLLYGELGAGKTQLVKGLAKGLGVCEWEYVVSPSFTLLNTYGGSLDLCHVDLYRLEKPDAEELGIEEHLDGGVVAVEWAEKWPWPDNAIRVVIDATGEEERRIVLEVEDAGRAEVWRNIGRESGEDSQRRRAGEGV